MTIPTATARPVDGWTERLIRYRWLFVVPVLLPLSLLFDVFWAARGFYVHRLRRAPERHDERVADVQRRIERWRAAGAPGRLCTARKPWMSIASRTARYKRPENAIRVELHDILDVNTTRGFARVEPLVAIGRLMRRLTAMGWTLPVVPEMDDLTVGGLFVGYGIESSSHRHGLFSDNVVACEVVLGDGRRVRASADENRDLFHALPWSLGALGFVVGLELRIVPLRRYVQVSYRPVNGLRQMAVALTEEAAGDKAPDFIEAVLFGPDEGVVITGVYADTAPPGRIHRANRWYAPWFAFRAREFAARGGFDEFVPTPQYFRRHHRGMFWENALIVPFANHPLFRFPFGWMMPPKVAFLRLTQGERIKRYYDEKHVLQDAILPIRHLGEALDHFDTILEAYPLWLCPVRLSRKEPRGLVGPADAAGDHEMYVDVAFMAIPGAVRRGEVFNALEGVRKLERFLVDHGGYQGTYAVTQLSRDDYRRMFDVALYERVRLDYGADGALMDAYDKLTSASPAAGEST